MENKYVCVLDFDSPIYAAASVGDSMYIEATCIDSGRVEEFRNVTEFWGPKKSEVGGWLAEQPGNFCKEDFEITKCTRRNPVITMDKMKSMVISSITKIESKEFCKELKLVIGGSGNYRNDIYSEYKANRKFTPRPTSLQPLREWLASEYDVIQIDGIEADDVLGIFAQYGYDKALKSGNYLDNDICGVFTDKDILQKSGWYYNPKTNLKAPLWQSETDAARCFWTQMLSGDTSDNIPGLKDVTDIVWKSHSLKGQRGVGAGNAKKLLADCEKPLDMEEKVLYLYRTFYEEQEVDWQEKFQLNYQLLKLMEYKNVIPKYEFK